MNNVKKPVYYSHEQVDKMMFIEMTCSRCHIHLGWIDDEHEWDRIIHCDKCRKTRILGA